MTHPAKRPLDSLLTQIYRAITPPRWAGEEAACLNFSNVELFENRGDRAMIIVAHQTGTIRAHCDHAAVLENGRLTVHESVDSAIAAYEAL